MNEMSSRTGVRVGSVVENRIRYRRYRPLGLVIAPPLVTVDQGDQFTPSVELLVSTVIVVPAGTLAGQAAVPQAQMLPASKTDEVKVPLKAYDVMPTESTCSGG